MVHLSSDKTSKQLAALTPSAEANFGSSRRCRFLCPLWQAGRGAGVPLLSPKHPANRGVLRLAVTAPTHLPSTFCFSCQQLLRGGDGRFAAEPRNHPPSHYHPAQLQFELGHLWIFQRGFPWEEGAHAQERVLPPSTPEIQARGLPSSPLWEL